MRLREGGRRDGHDAATLPSVAARVTVSRRGRSCRCGMAVLRKAGPGAEAELMLRP
ncbi:hypothetical protein [Azospirillum endophyticum]